MRNNRVVVTGIDRKAADCRRFFAKYDFDVVSSAEIDEAEPSASNCPVVYSSSHGGFYAKAKRLLNKTTIPDKKSANFSALSSESTERLIDALSFNSPNEPNEYVRCLLEAQPKSSGQARSILMAYQRNKIKSAIDNGQKTLGVYYPSRAYRANLGSEQMYERIKSQGYNVVFLFGVIRSDEYEKRPYSFYVGHNIVKQLDFIDLFIMPTLTLDLPRRSKKILFVHDIYDSPRGKAEAPRKGWDGKPKWVSPLIAELDYTFLPARSIMPKSHICPLIRRKPLCRIPGGYMKLDYNMRCFEKNKLPIDSLIYAPTVCGGKFKKYVSLPGYGVDIVGALLEHFGDYRIIFRPHPHTLESRHVTKIANRFRNNDRFTLDSNASFYMDNYSRSAAMVTDMSGTAFTYAFTTLRPVVFFSHNEDTVEEAFDRVAYFRDREKIGHIATSTDELVEKMSLALKEQDEFSDRIREFRDSEIFNAGRAEDYFAENFRCIAEGIKHPDWQYVISAIEPFDDESPKTANEARSDQEKAKPIEHVPCLMVEGYEG
ncbi:MAG: CDP-glycerol glycerophosphotransferase family protein, partial [Planctomycetota bacterium]